MALPAASLGGAAAGAAGQVNLLTAALSDLWNKLPTQKIQDMESAIYDMQAATGMSAKEADRFSSSIHKLTDAQNQYTRTALVSTMAQLRSMPTLLTANTREF